MPSFQNNFGTNLTSSTSSGATTSPINSIPTVDAPYYIAFDATNINAHYEVVHVTSDTATNVLHAATVYDHTTAEEVRMVLPAVHLNTMQNMPVGTMINGKITPTDAAGLTLTLQTLAGATPSVTDPVYVNIGGTIRAITAALSVAKADGTNWCNAGSAELATKEIDYFAYLGYNATDGVVIGFSRIPSAALYSDFSATTTNEKYCAISTISNAAAGDNYVNIGRFAATLSAGAGYTWSVPTFTASNLIQRPIYETRLLDYVPTITWNSTAPTTLTTRAKYKIVSDRCKVRVIQSATGAGTTNTQTLVTVPFNSSADNGAWSGSFAGYVSTAEWTSIPTAQARATLYDHPATTTIYLNYTSLSAKYGMVQGEYEI